MGGAHCEFLMGDHKRAHNGGVVDAGPRSSPVPSVSSLEEECELFHQVSLPSFGPLPLGQAPLQRTHGSRLASRGGSSFMKHGIPCCWLVVK